MAKNKNMMLGLDKRGRVDMELLPNRLCEYMVDHGFHGRCIAEKTGLTVGQVYYRARICEVHLRDYRDGVGKEAVLIIKNFKVRNVNAA